MKLYAWYNGKKSKNAEYYFIETHDGYHEFVRDEAYSWWMGKNKAGSITIEDLYYEYREVIEFMAYEEANAVADVKYKVCSLKELCKDINEAMREYEV